jgi:ribosome-associated protein
MQERKAQDIAVLDMRKIHNAVADFFVICSANSDTQVDAIAESVESEVYKAVEVHATHKEGKENREWILLDYSDIMVHVFRKDRRKFYGLEDLWGDSNIKYIENLD